MKYHKVDLFQIEQNDIGTVKKILNAFRHHLPEHRELNTYLLNEKYERQLADQNSYHTAIKLSTEGDFKKIIGGLAYIKDIDWISRHGELVFMMEDDGLNKGSIKDTEISKLAFEKVLDFCFDELNLNKIWIEVIDGNEIKHILEEFGFVAEGVRRQARFKDGKYVDSTICSLLSQEHTEDEDGEKL